MPNFKNLFATIVLLLLVIGCVAQNQLTGVIFDSSNGERLPYANVYTNDLKNSTSSDVYGQFVLTISQDVSEIIVSSVGYIPDTISLVNKDFISPLTVKLFSTSYALESITVVSSRIQEDIEIENGTNRAELSTKKISKIPVILGQKDILKAYQILPGVQGNQEGFSGLQVRGGTSDQTSYYLDGARVYNTSHAFGFISTFDNNAIKHSSLEKGGISASRGEGMSANMELISRDGNKSRHEGELDLGLISIGAYLSGPIKREQISYSISARTTLYDWIVRTVSPGEATSIGFYDLNFKVHHQDLKNTLQISSYNGHDNFINESRDGKSIIDWGNNTISLRWTHLAKSDLSLENFLTWSKFDYSTDLINYDKDRNEFRSRNKTGISDLGWDGIISKTLASNTVLRLGAGFHNIRHQVGSYDVDSLQSPIFKTDNVTSNNLNGFIEFKTSAFKRSSLQAGVRFGLQAVEGEVFPIIEPRLSYSFSLSEKFSISSSGQLTSQTIHRVNTSGIGLQTDLWIPSTDQIKPQRAAQFSLGFNWKNRPKISLGSEIFYKRYFNVTDLTDNASFGTVYTHGPDVILFNDQGDWSNQIAQGIGFSRGLEFNVNTELTSRSLFYLAYTLGYSKNKIDGVNSGDWYWSSADRRHSVLINYEYKWKPRLSLFLNWTYNTGVRVSLPESRYKDRSPVYLSNGSSGKPEYFEVSEVNGVNLPAWHRLDITLRKQGKKNKENYWEVGLYNAYNRNNPFYVQIKGGRLIAKGLYPILPSFTYHLQLY